MSPKTSAIAKRPKRPPTPAERLRALDPDLADLFDAWEADLDREYDLALNEDPAAPILDAEVTLVAEGGRLLDTAAVLYATVDDLQVTADAARAALARLALEAFTHSGYTTYRQPALPPPPDSFDGGDDTEDFHHLPARVEQREALNNLTRQDEEAGLYELDGRDGPWARAVRKGGWWRRVRGWLRPAAITAAAILLAITAGGGS